MSELPHKQAEHEALYGSFRGVDYANDLTNERLLVNRFIRMKPAIYDKCRQLKELVVLFSSYCKKQTHTHTDVLVRFPLFDQLCEAALHDAGRPFVHLSLVVVVIAYDALDTLFDNIISLFRVERALAAVMIFLHSCHLSQIQSG